MSNAAEVDLHDYIMQEKNLKSFCTLAYIMVMVMSHGILLFLL